jgi:hypothetical protein
MFWLNEVICPFLFRRGITNEHHFVFKYASYRSMNIGHEIAFRRSLHERTFQNHYPSGMTLQDIPADTQPCKQVPLTYNEATTGDTICCLSLPVVAPFASGQTDCTTQSTARITNVSVKFTLRSIETCNLTRHSLVATTC